MRSSFSEAVMKSLLINTSDIQGGAARATYRLHKGLQEIGIDSKMLVQKKISDDPSVIGPISYFGNKMSNVSYFLDRLPLKYYHNYQHTPWSPQWLPKSLHKKIKSIDPDVVHLHWICGGFVPVKEIAKIDKPIVWTLHDMWAFTGGCHVGACDKYEGQCGSCPQLGSKKEYDLSSWVWRRKKKYWEGLDFTVVTPSHWLANCARSSSLLGDKRIEVIPHGLDLQKFRPITKDDARKALNLPLDKNLILFGAMNSTKDKNKGFQYLKSAIGMLSEDLDIEAVVFGNSEHENNDTFKIPIRYLGHISNDKQLSLLYSSADVMVVPSIQEAFGQTASEAMACGTPVVSFNSTGLIDIVKHKENGYLAKLFDSGDLAKGIEWVIEGNQRKKKLSEYSRKYVENNFELKSVAKKYSDLYSELY